MMVRPMRKGMMIATSRMEFVAFNHKIGVTVLCVDLSRACGLAAGESGEEVVSDLPVQVARG